MGPGEEARPGLQRDRLHARPLPEGIEAGRGQEEQDDLLLALFLPVGQAADDPCFHGGLPCVCTSEWFADRLLRSQSEVGSAEHQQLDLPCELRVPGHQLRILLGRLLGRCAHVRVREAARRRCHDGGHPVEVEVPALHFVGAAVRVLLPDFLLLRRSGRVDCREQDSSDAQVRLCGGAEAEVGQAGRDCGCGVSGAAFHIHACVAPCVRLLERPAPPVEANQSGRRRLLL
mmetsp:Transcript_73359/g.185836  ORF Transcript_73359/g.185836 Transcript_73359/m.185836 type:complete len:231 (-) Transcript_73359:38-730(-)